mgnify:FL=1
MQYMYIVYDPSINDIVLYLLLLHFLSTRNINIYTHRPKKKVKKRHIKLMMICPIQQVTMGVLKINIYAAFLNLLKCLGL